MYRIQRILCDHFESFSAAGKHRVEVHKAAGAMMRCRTAALGGHTEACPDGHFQRNFYNSCRNRNCPLCAFIHVSRWLNRQISRLVGCDYYHVIFTVDHKLNVLWRYNRREFVNLFFQAAWGSLKEMLADPRHLGALPGALGSLHTWTQTLGGHVHLHFLVTAGGIGPDGNWVQHEGQWLLPGKALGRKFRGKFLALLRRGVESGRLQLPPGMWKQKCLNLLNKLGRGKCVVEIRPRYNHGRGVLAYLARYVRGGPISERRIVGYDGNNVSIRYRINGERGSSSPARQGVLPLTAPEFLERLLQHVAPKGAHYVRAYGLFHPSQRDALDVARDRFGQLPAEDRPEPSWQQICAQAGELHPQRCPICGKELITISLLTPIRSTRSARAPPCKRTAA